MPYSLKQLVGRMEAASQAINDERSYIEGYLFKELEFNTEVFFQSLGDADLESTRASSDKTVEGFNHIHVVLRNEEARRQFLKKIESKEKEEEAKVKRKFLHERHRRNLRISKTKPYPTRSNSELN